MALPVNSLHPHRKGYRSVVHATLALAAAMLLLGTSPAQATSIASAAASSGGSWGGAGSNTWTPTGPGSVVAVSELNTRLAAGAHVVVQTHVGEPALAVKAALTLGSGSHLELQAGGDVSIQAPVHAGAAWVTLRYGQQAVAAGNSATVVASAPVHLDAGSQYRTQLGSDGTDMAHTIITGLGAQGSTTANDLQGMQGNLGGRYVLGSDIDASATSGWNGGTGFVPVGNSGTTFTGSLDGLGHTITGLRILPTQFHVGLFGRAVGAQLRNIGLENTEVRGIGHVGALVGWLEGGAVSSSYASVKASVSNGSVGGLIGSCQDNCTINSSYATGEVAAGNSGAGGLVGTCRDNCTINSSYATGRVSAGTAYAGGLVGACQSNCTINSSYATGRVSVGAAYAGGLVGYCSGSYAFTSSFYATSDAGGSPINNGGAANGDWSGNAHGTPKTLTELQTQATFSGWNIDDAGGTGTTWRIYPGQTTPLLRSLFTAPLTITATSGSRAANGTTNALGVAYTPASPDARLLGTPVATAAGSAVGTHAITVSGVHSTQRGYDIALVPGTLSITAVPVPPAPEPESPPPLSVTSASVITVTDPGRPITVGPDAGGSSIVLPGTGTTPVQLQIAVNGQALAVAALPGTLLQVTRVNGQSVLVLVVLRGWASMESSSAGQPMVLAGDVVLRSGVAGTRIEAQRLAVAVVRGVLVPPQGVLPQLGGKGLLEGERLLVDSAGKLEGIALGSLKGDAQQAGDVMAFANLPPALTVEQRFARLDGAVARLAGAHLAQDLEIAPSGVVLVRDGGQVFQLLPTLPITIDATMPDGFTFTPLGLLRWVRGGVVVQFAPAVADLAGLAAAVAAQWPDATIKLAAEGVLQLTLGGQTRVLRPEWTGAGNTTGTPKVAMDKDGLRFSAGNGPVQWLLPALLSYTQAQKLFEAALPGAALAVQPASREGAFTITVAGQVWRLVPQVLLPTGAVGQAPTPAADWWLGGDGVLYLRLSSRAQGVRVVD